MRRGFTLIELLIVMAILGILSAIGIGNFRTARIKATDAERKANLVAVAKSLEAYNNDHGSYPTTNLSWGTPFTDGTSTYMSLLPDDYYYYTSDGISYTLYTYLGNTQDPQIVDGLTTTCGSATCNYQLKSSNQP